MKEKRKLVFKKTNIANLGEIKGGQHFTYLNYTCDPDLCFDKETYVCATKVFSKCSPSCPYCIPSNDCN